MRLSTPERAAANHRPVFDEQRPANAADVPPPAALDAERAVVARVLLEPGLFQEADAIMGNALYDDELRRVWRAMRSLRLEGRTPDAVQVAEYLHAKGISATVLLAQLINEVPHLERWREHAQLVAEKARLRAASAVLLQAAAECRGGPADVPAWGASVLARLTDVFGEAGGSARFPAIGAEQIFERLEPIQHVIAGLDLCPGAPAMWAGYGFSGKTLAAQSAALTIASDLEERRVWGCFGAKQGRVMHLDYEQGSRLTRERYQRLAAGMLLGPADLGDRLSLVTMPTTYLDQPEAEDGLARLVDGYTLCIIDSLRAAAPSLDENSSEVRRVLDMMGRVSERTGCTFIVIHHARKPSRDAAGGAKMAIRGSGALFDACASVLVFEAEKGQPTRVSHEKARSSGRLADDFGLSIGDVEVDGDPRGGVAVTAQAAASREDVAEEQARGKQAARQEKIKSEVRALFADKAEQRSAESIAEQIRRNVPEVRKVLKVLRDAGEVTESGSTSDRRLTYVGRE